VLVLGTAAFVGVVAYSAIGDIRAETTRLQRAAPEAAGRLEASARFGRAARDFHLRARVQDFVDALPAKLLGGTGAAAFTTNANRVVAVLANFVLTIFLLLYGPRILGAGIRRIGDPARRDRVTNVLLRAYRRAWRYTIGTLGMALASGLFAFLVARVLALPAPAALAVLVGIGSILPFVGIVIGGLPMILLTAGVDPTSYKVAVVAGLLVGYQLFEALLLQPIVHRWSIRFGPALTVVVVMVGFELYGVAGALTGLMVAVLAVAVLDELAPVVAMEDQVGAEDQIEPPGTPAAR
jgi:predicted PurR-regulated permease PerM